nr:PREDICTED: uncharacterized protein LOC109044759 [Bemisia tabaci]
MRWLWLALVLLVTTVIALNGNPPPLVITRHHLGDIFSTSDSPCSSDVCVGRSSGTAGLEKNQGFPNNQCTCQCMPNLPIFRDDKHICVDDLNECTLAPFVSGSTVQKIPFVFLPLKGQIVYPSAEIQFRGSVTPMCVVSKALFLTGGGWADLRNRSDTEPPFRLFRDEGRTFLRWLGDADLRLSMEGRLIKVDLICKEVDKMNLQDQQIFTPCVAFRVAGTPSVREVSFSADMRNAVGKEADTRSLSAAEQIAIGIFCLSIGFIYVAAIYFYLRKRHRIKHGCFKGDTESVDGNTRDSLIIPDEGVVKNNPLLQHCPEGQDNEGFLSESGGSCCSDTERSENCLDDKMQRTWAMVHPRRHGGGGGGGNEGQGHGQGGEGSEEGIYNMEPLQLSDQNTIERLPEENVSIVETLEQREDRPETVKAMTCANARKKLYFNPAYFEPELLLAPPPAAIEFLTKIREVIAIAKHKMAAKKFTPNLIGIPEEDYGNPLRPTSRMSSVRSSRHGGASYRHERSRPSSLIKEEHGRAGRSSIISCEDCPDCQRELQQQENVCRHCYNNNHHQAETKQKSIRKWLQDVPLQPKCPLSDSESVASSKCSRRSCHNRAIAKRHGLDDHHFSSRLMPSGTAIKFIENEFNDQSSIMSGRSGNSGKSGRSGRSARSGKSAQSATSYRSGRSCRSNLSRKSIAFSNLPYVNQQNEINRMKTIQEDLMSTAESEGRKNGSNAASRTKMKPPPCPPPPPPPPSMCSGDTGVVDTESLAESSVSKENFKVPKVAKKLMDAVIKEFVGVRGLNDTDPREEQPSPVEEEFRAEPVVNPPPHRSKISETRSPLPMKKNGESKLNSKIIVHQHNPALNATDIEKDDNSSPAPVAETEKTKVGVAVENTSKPIPPLRLDSLKSRDEGRLSDFETDSLDKSIYDLNGDDRGIRTPSDYGDVLIKRTELNNGLIHCSRLPMDEEVEMRNDILNMTTGNKTISKMARSPRPPLIEDHEYEIISMAQNEIQTGRPMSKNDILADHTEPEGYSLVSEVYINDTFGSGSTSNSSSLTSNQTNPPEPPNGKDAKIHYKQQPGHLMIEVEDTDHTYNPDDSDSFEPDTLDRKPVSNKLKPFENNNNLISAFNKNRAVPDSIYTDYEFTDSLERPPHANGGFKRDRTLNEDLNELLNKVTNSHNIGNLRAIFESKQNNLKKANAKPEKKYMNHKTRAEIEMNQLNLRNDKNSRIDKNSKSEKGSRRDKNLRSDNSLSSSMTNGGDDSDTDYSTLSWDTEKDYGKFLNVDSKQARRQRPPSPPKPFIELKPPRPPKPSDYYNEIELRSVDKTPPLPPRSIKPPLPPKNAMVRSTRDKVGLPPRITKLSLSDMNRRPLPELPNVTNSAPHKTTPAASGRTKSPISSDYEAMNTDGRQGDDNDEKPKAKLLIGPNGTNGKRSKKRLWRHYTEDSGYLSTDSNESNENRKRVLSEIISGSETDESFDGASESGAESMATDSFFYGNNFRKTPNTPKSGSLSVDSGLNQSDSDSNVSFVTVLPTENKNAKILAKGNLQKVLADGGRQ